MEYLIGLDLGTTTAKAVALTAANKVLGEASADYPLLTGGSPDRAVQEADDIWRGVETVLQELDEQVPLHDALGLCFSGAMHNLLPVGPAGEPLAPALTWADNQAAGTAASLRREVDDAALYRRTGCPLQAIYHPARLRWWHDRGVPPETTRFVGLKDWVLYRLTGTWAADLALASTTGLLDIRRRRWDEEALALAGVSAGQLPPLVAPDAVCGKVTPTAASVTGLRAGLPIVAGNHDGGLANIGAGATAPDAMAISVGTSGAVRLVVDSPTLDPEMRTWCYLLVGDTWLAGGAINNGGLAVQWVREQFFRDLPGNWQARTEAMIARAADVPPGAEGVIILPYLTGERTPHWNADGRATIHGLSLAHTRAHVARATLEAVAFCLADVWRALERGLAGDFDRSRPVALTGGITSSPLWCQIVSDVLNLSLRPAGQTDASALGAALLGLTALGLSDTLQPQKEPAPAPVYRPDPARHALYRDRHARFRALYRRLYPR